MSKFDVKECFMSEEHEKLVRAFVPLVEQEVRDIAEAMLWLVLGTHFVVHGADTFRVQSGTGMGQVHSGALSDVAFWAIAERKLQHSDLGILCYL